MGNVTDTLIAKYLNNECTEEECSILEKWMENSEKNKEQIEMAQKILDKEDRNDFNPDTEKALKQILDLLPEQKKPISGRKWNWLKVAAVLLLAIGATYLAIRFSENQEIELIAFQQNTIDNARVQLPDGSIIWIRKGGEVVYPSQFRGKERKISFTGEGYFEIATDARHPFIIEAEGTITRVLGTKFVLNTMSKDSMVYLILAEGKVEFSTGSSKKEDFKKLEPGQKLSFNKADNKIDINKNTNLNYLSWKTKSYVFTNSSLEEIVRIIEDFYNVRFDELPKALASEKFKIEFDSLYTVEQVLENLEILTEAKIEKAGENYYFKTNS